MTLLLIIAVAGFLYGWITYKPPRKKKAPTGPPTVITMEYCKQQERERKRQQRIEAATEEMEHKKALRDFYNAECARLEEKLKGETAESKREKLQNRLFALDEKVYRCDAQLAKLYNIIHN